MAASGALTLCCLLWARPGMAADLTVYEDTVLALVAEHGAQVVQRVRSVPDDRGVPSELEAPTEVQVFTFPGQDALDAYRADPRRAALAAERDRVVARTELFPVTLVPTV
ncbi:hypothetical protein [Ruania halotolerans]|uniref:hypothetical protein n=1 Tax=Ruania halotolerans TaxID=2897773 RepID=UPI001E52E0EB|nr:hypothetical protein [Ruania halotolerans]UFU06451.1 hypothetical protein LQF10_18835 [Ruania halotolerans]